MVSRRYFLKSSGLAMVSLGFEPAFFARIARGRTPEEGESTGNHFSTWGCRWSEHRDSFRGEELLRPETHDCDSRAIFKPGASGAGSRWLLCFSPGAGAAAPTVQIQAPGHRSCRRIPGQYAFSLRCSGLYGVCRHQGMKSTRDGWLNRYLLTRPDADSTPFRAVSMTVVDASLITRESPGSRDRAISESSMSGAGGLRPGQDMPSNGCMPRLRAACFRVSERKPLKR